MQELWCERGEHMWERGDIKGRRPMSCQDHPKTRAEIDEDSEEERLRRIEKAELRIDALEVLLKSRGTHLSQNDY